MPSYLRFAGASLPGSVGSDVPGGARISDGRAGHLSFGPHVSLEPGRYIAGFRLKKLPNCQAGRITVDVYSPATGVLSSNFVYSSELFEATSSLNHLEFSLDQTAHQLEARMYVQEGIMVQLDELVIFAQDSRGWDG